MKNVLTKKKSFFAVKIIFLSQLADIFLVINKTFLELITCVFLLLMKLM